MNRYLNSLQFKIFIVFISIIIPVIAIISITVMCYLYNDVQKNMISSLDSMADTQMSGIDQEYMTMDAIALNILSSYSIRDYFTSSDRYSSEQNLIKAMTSTVAPSFSVHCAIFYDLGGKVFCTQGGSNINGEVKNMSWLSQVIQKDGLAYISTPFHSDDPSVSIVKTSREQLLSLMRACFNQYHVVNGVVEVRQYYNNFFAALDTLSDNAMYNDVVVFDQYNRIIYPADGKPVTSDYLTWIKDATPRERIHDNIIRKKTDKGTMLIAFKTSDKTGFTLVTSSSEKALFSSIYDSVRIILLLTIIVVVTLVLLSYFSTRKITNPIIKLEHQMEEWQLSANGNGTVEVTDCGIHEIDQLYHSFYKMDTEARSTLQKLLLSQQQELQFKLLALNSQMNPHFLYNSLAIISAMAEEGSNKDITIFCKNLSKMLRYISSSTDNIICIGEECEHTVNYLNCIQARYKDKLKYRIDVPECLQTLLIPKLSIQPLVENSVKFCTKQSPPWMIQIVGNTFEKGWSIKVIDNGPGMNKEALDILHKKIDDINNGKVLPLQPNGLGLINVYIRLRLLYKENAIFHIETNDGGTTVQIGRCNIED